MQKNLVIVESPAKAKTIEKFLGKGYKVLSSYGHIRDLKKKGFGIDIENNFAPDYEVPEDKNELVTKLKQEAAKADIVWLASDEDREGEAISWHLFQVLDLDPAKTKRIVFHEITKNAILHAIEHPRAIDTNLVNAQQARRILDRLVGFEVSPILWRKVKPSLSAGRVQSVAVRLIVEREREIQQFVPTASYRVVGLFPVVDKEGKTTLMKAQLGRRLPTKEEAQALLETCKSATFTIADVTTQPTKKYPAPPFTTSTLQQEAARKLGFTVSQTMMVAQRLYESGYITYMRTDSVNLSQLALATSKQVITDMLNEKYVHTRHYNTKSKGAQEAHEAIRPTAMDRSSVNASQREERLYELIWKRTLASQMAEAQLEKTTATISISGSEDVFVATGEVITFDGFLRVYMESFDDDNEQEDTRLLPPLTVGATLETNEITATERFTTRPPRYTEARLVRKLEELGIGRPSTYAPTISTIQNRDYVAKELKEGKERQYSILTLKEGAITDEQKTEVYGTDRSKLSPTDIGTVVTDYLMDAFPSIMDYNFTANVEMQFDDIAEGDKEWTQMIQHFYGAFHPMVETALAQKSEHRIGQRELGMDPKTGRPVFVKIGRYGPLVQIGDAADEEKPLFANVPRNMSIETITLEEALEQFKLPRTVGEFEEAELIVNSGRFGPYVRHSGKFVSIPKEIDPLEITAEECIRLIQEKRTRDAQKIIKTFEEEPELQILNGRYGPYIAFEGNNYRIPKTVEAADLNLEACKEIVRLEQEKPKKTKRRKTTKKATTKKAAAKKTTTKKKTTAKKATKKEA
jgi:DNA topoisomerase-1